VHRLIKRRGKSGLVKLNLDWEGAKTVRAAPSRAPHRHAHGAPHRPRATPA